MRLKNLEVAGIVLGVLGIGAAYYFSKQPSGKKTGSGTGTTTSQTGNTQGPNNVNYPNFGSLPVLPSVPNGDTLLAGSSYQGYSVVVTGGQNLPTGGIPQVVGVVKQ